jgi:hypothetical protein
LPKIALLGVQFSSLLEAWFDLVDRCLFPNPMGQRGLPERQAGGGEPGFEVPGSVGFGAQGEVPVGAVSAVLILRCASVRKQCCDDPLREDPQSAYVGVLRMARQG